MIADRQAPRFPRRLRGRLRRRRPTSSAVDVDLRGALRLFVGPFAGRSPTGRCSIATTPISIRRCMRDSAPLYTNTVSNTAFRGFGGPQGMVGAERVIEEIAFAARQGPARRPQGAISTAPGRATSRPITRRSRTTSSSRIVDELEQSSDYQRRRREDRRLQRQQPRHQARHGADAGQVRHLVHGDPLQPGRRAGACLYRRLGASEPRRHRDGAGTLRQGRAGGGGGVPDRPRPGKITATTTGKVPNTSATAASSGSDLNGMAAQNAARRSKSG